MSVYDEKYWDDFEYDFYTDMDDDEDQYMQDALDDDIYTYANFLFNEEDDFESEDDYFEED